jgi:hypothetical protein
MHGRDQASITGADVKELSGAVVCQCGVAEQEEGVPLTVKSLATSRGCGESADSRGNGVCWQTSKSGCEAEEGHTAPVCLITLSSSR